MKKTKHKNGRVSVRRKTVRTGTRRSKSTVHLSLISDSLKGLEKWERTWPPFSEDESLRIPRGVMESSLRELVDRLGDNYPFFHPSYAGQMLKPPHSVASIAYFITQQINPNNHALDGGPATAKMELEVIDQLAAMFGYDAHLGHLTSSGTIANLEALWVARSLHPGKSIAFSSEAHYTHRRVCDVIGVRAVEIGVDARGRMDLDALRGKLKSENIGTVVLTAGTTGLGAVDQVDEALPLKQEFGCRIHVDAAYGGFFTLLKDETDLLDEETRRAFHAIGQSDSVVVDPHKHGLQPYGCGSVMFRDPAVGKFYKHDSPYTYFTSKELHLGEISLECSRAGASAAALWTTLRCFPLKARRGLGPILAKTRKAAMKFADLIQHDSYFRTITSPALDIVSYYPVTADRRVSHISRLTDRIFETSMNQTNPLYLAKMAVKRGPLPEDSDLSWDLPTMNVLRSVLMKPEHLHFVPHLYEQLVELAKHIRDDEAERSSR